MVTVSAAARAIAAFDISDVALYVDDTWRAPFAQLRAEMPVSWCAQSAYGGYWSVVTHELISQVELDPMTYSSSWENGNIVIADPKPETNLQNFIAADPPVHTEQRKVIAPAFAPSQMATREAQVRALCSETLNALPLGETIDWVNRVSVPLTIGMLCILFDMPLDEWRDLKRWSDYASSVNPDNDNDAYRAESMGQLMQMLDRFDRLLGQRKGETPADDLISRMVHSTAMGNMSPLERLSNIALLIVGGNDTTRHSMGGLVEVLDRWPAELDRLHADPTLIASAAQELVRWQSPVTHMRRTATRDATLGGQHIAKGEKVIMWYLSANRDETVFADAERFDVGRANARRHLGFGHGIHRCVGARLAEIQLATLIGEIVTRNWRIVPQGAPTRLASPFLHGFTAMPVVIAPRG